MAKKTKRKRIKRKQRQPKLSRAETTAIVRVDKPEVLTTSVRSMISMVRKVQETVADLERVRRFVSTCLNIDLQKWEVKHPFPASGTPDEKKAWEEERKSLEVDWGTIPGDDKPFLMQPGAEKFLFWLELRPEYVNQLTLFDEGHIELVSHVMFFHKRTKEKVFDGPDCSCTTMETNYRFIWAERPSCTHFPAQSDCQQCQRKDLLKATKMGRSLKVNEWKKGVVVGKKWIWQERVENPNVWNERNKVRQIAQKRALVKGVRNMGAISEIFRQPPDEWDIPEEREDTQEVDADYTDSGRHVYINGKSPSGRHTDPAAQRAQEQQDSIDNLKAKGAAYWCTEHQCPVSERHYNECEFSRKAIEAEKSGKNPDGSPLKENTVPSTRASSTTPATPVAAPVVAGVPAGKVTVDCTDPKGIVVRGDLANFTEALEQHCAAKFLEGWWRIPPEHVNTVAAMCKQGNYEFERIDPVKKSEPVKKSASKSPAKATPGEHTIEGVIEKAVTKQGSRPRIDFLVKTDHGSFWMGCWSKTWFTLLAQEPFPKPVTLVVETRVKENATFRNIKWAPKIRGKEYDEDAKPVIQQREREAGGQTLFP